MGFSIEQPIAYFYFMTIFVLSFSIVNDHKPIILQRCPRQTGFVLLS